jgi:DNA-binding NtrC family response regulator
MEWIGVLSPAGLQHPTRAKLVLDNFYDYHTLPLDTKRLSVVLGHAFGKTALKRQLSRKADALGRYGMIGKSPAMLRLYSMIDRVIGVEAPVLIAGESGTGKELVARAIHQHSSRAKGPFVVVNCGELPETLIQSVLFGHERGAFTGAVQRRVGSIEAAAGGLIFLDEIGDLQLDLQANLLRFLQEKTIIRVGSTQPIRVDVRVIAASHVDLQRAVEDGRFREDLYYRLNVLRLDVPPLRARHEDIHLFLDALLKEFAGQKNPRVRGYSQDALRAMRAYSWPGNVRELINRVQHALIMSENRLIGPTDLGIPAPSAQSNVVSLSRARAAASRAVIESVLRSTDHNVTRAARELGVSRVTLYRLMEKLDIGRPD